MARRSCQLSVVGYGSYELDCIDLSYGIKFEGNEGTARHHHTYYPKRQDNGDFAITLRFSKFEKYDSFIRWMIGYGRRLADADQIPVAMRVRVPSRNFDRKGVPLRGVEMGVSYDDVVWDVPLTFTGVEDEVIAFNNPGLSHMVQPTQDWETSRYFYPEGVQLDAEDRELAALQAERDARIEQWENQGLVPQGSAPRRVGPSLTSRDVSEPGFAGFD
jgi:hypothetical protein